eukprot:TRINITY_DN31728_c0_g1_i1.p1 TRINITY_DN31728_c0_g1~~TRINITY_DN31728_c0_g1_i1.p1  ORF type:complete len:221 (-),score=35.68 TRINITY_DN31728_c0_g1_i1:23-685(-)
MCIRDRVSTQSTWGINLGFLSNLNGNYLSLPIDFSSEDSDCPSEPLSSLFPYLTVSHKDSVEMKRLNHIWQTTPNCRLSAQKKRRMQEATTLALAEVIEVQPRLGSILARYLGKEPDCASLSSMIGKDISEALKKVSCRLSSSFSNAGERKIHNTTPQKYSIERKHSQASLKVQIPKKGKKATSFRKRYFHRNYQQTQACLLYTSPSPRDLSTSRMPSSA